MPHKSEHHSKLHSNLLLRQMENPTTISQQNLEDAIPVRLSFSDHGTSDACHEHAPTAAISFDFDFQFYSSRHQPVSSQRDDVFLLFGKIMNPLIDGKKREEDQICCDYNRDDDLPEERLFLLRSRSFKELKSSATTAATRTGCGGPQRSLSSRKEWLGIIGIPSRMELSDIRRRQKKINKSSRWLSAEVDGRDSTAVEPEKSRWGFARKWRWCRP